MRSLIFSAAFIAILASCTGSEPQLSDNERELILRLGFDELVMARVGRFGESFERLVSVTPEFERAPADGLVLVTEPSGGRSALMEVRTELRGSDYAAYLNDEAFGYAADRIAIVESHGDYDYLAMMRTDGINYDLEHEDVLARYQRWDESFGLSLIGAGQDWLEAEFSMPPDDWIAFAEEVYEFCPDVVDQGTGDVETLAAEMRASNTVYLWWD